MTAGLLRLFVGLPVPAAIRERLAPLIPAARPGLKPSGPDDIHLTLHFLGLAAADEVAAALETVQAPPLHLTLGAPGRFLLRGGRSVLYVGVAPTPALDALHAATAAALAGTGFRPERRPFRPHLTLARIGGDAGDDIIDTFLARSSPAAGFDCAAFALFESRPDAAGPRYRILRSFPLAAIGAER